MGIGQRICPASGSGLLTVSGKLSTTKDGRPRIPWREQQLWQHEKLWLRKLSLMRRQSCSGEMIVEQGSDILKMEVGM